MPKLVCRACGQGVYTTAPFEALFADERRCPRCGKLLFSDRRLGMSRRKAQRRGAAAEPADPAPPTGGHGASHHPAAVPGASPERRVADRRQTKRRKDDQNPFQRGDETGWVE